MAALNKSGLSADELEHCLQTAELVTFSTTNPNGTIHSVPVWYRWDGETCWVISAKDQRKIKNLHRDPRVSLLLHVLRTPERPTEIALVYGRATIHDLPHEQFQAKALWIWSKYVGEDGARERIAPIPEGAACVLEIRPDKTISWHP